SAGASEEPGAEAGRRSEDTGGELPAGEETLAAISRRRSQRAPAPQRRKRLESGEAREIPAEGAAADPGEVFGNGTGAVWTNAGSGTFSGRGWAGGGRGDAAALDVSGGVVEPPAETEAHRKRRERRQHFGDLVQMDGSFHAWFEERGPRGCLMNMV